MRLAGQILVFLVLLGFLAVRWVNSDAWASLFFKVLWWTCCCWWSLNVWRSLRRGW